MNSHTSTSTSTDSGPTGEAELLASARRRQTATRIRATGLAPADPNEPAPLTHAQRRMWLMDQLSPDTDRYNVPFATRIRGPLDLSALGRALTALVRRHAILRTRYFVTGDGEPRQQATATTPVRLDVLDHPGDDATALLRVLAAQPFDLATGPVLRAAVVRHAPEDHTVLLTFHHIAVDGASIALISEQLAGLYRDALDGNPGARGVPAEAAYPAPQYADFARREHQTASAPSRSLDYWAAHLAEAVPVTLPRPAHGAGANGTAILHAPLSPETLQGLRGAATARRTTLFTVVLAAAYAALLEVTGQEDLVIGCASANRERPELRELIGLCVNTLPLRADLAGVQDFGTALTRVHEVLLSAQEHREAPLDAIVDGLGAHARDSDGTALVTVSAELLRPAEALRLPGTTGETVEVDLGTAKFPLGLCVEESSNDAAAPCALVHYDRSRLCPEAAQALLGSFTRVLTSAALDPATSLVRPRTASPHPAEAYALSRPEVAEASLVGEGTEDSTLYVVPSRTGGLDPGRLRIALRTRLLPPLVTPAVTVVDALPGPLPSGTAAALGSSASVPPSGPAVCAAFAELLGQEVWPEDDFFVLGGHSLLAVRLAEQLRRRFSLPLTGLDVMQQRTPRALADLLDVRSSERAAVVRCGPRPRADGSVLLTGATGGVGAFILRELLAQGRPVRALARPESAHLLPGESVEIVEGDLANPATLRSALSGTSSIIHAACTFTSPEVDRAAMRTILDAWQDGTFVFISSIDAYGQPDTADVREDTTPHGPHSPYGQTKLDCEGMLLTAAGRAGRGGASVIRAPLVWGAHPRLREQLRWGATGLLYQAALAGLPIPLPAAHPDGNEPISTPWVHAAALARAATSCVDHPLGGRGNAVSGHVSWRDLAAELSLLLGTPGASGSIRSQLDPALPVHLHRRRYRAGQLSALLAPRPDEGWRSTLATMTKMATA